MLETHVAIRGIVDAVYGLHNEGKFTDLIGSLYETVLPKYVALNSPLGGAISCFDTTDPLAASPARIPPPGSYVRYSREFALRRADFEGALQEWAREGHLTCDLTTSGECLPWAIEFGRALCEGRPFAVAEPNRPSAPMPPPTGKWPICNPNPAKENRSDWERRIRGTLRQWYSAERKRQRSNPYPDPGKRKPDHYKWFVLHVCGGYSYNKIAEVLGVPVQADAIRKGVQSVRLALGLTRK